MQINNNNKKRKLNQRIGQKEDANIIILYLVFGKFERKISDKEKLEQNKRCNI